MRQRTNLMSIKGRTPDPLLPSCDLLRAGCQDLARRAPWRGTAGELLSYLGEHAGPGAPAWCGPRSLAVALRNAAPNLAEHGIAIRFQRQSGGQRTRLIEIERRLMGDAREIESMAQVRLADEDAAAPGRGEGQRQGDALILQEQADAILARCYREAQEQGEVAGHGGGRNFKIPDEKLEQPTTAEVGIDPKVTMNGRLVNAAEAAQPAAPRPKLPLRCCWCGAGPQGGGGYFATVNGLPMHVHPCARNWRRAKGR